MAHAQTTYSFPILSNTEILACLRELDVPLSETDLLKPTHDGLRPAYETLIEIFFGTTMAELGAIDEEAYAKLDYQELYDEAIPTLAFIRAMQDLARGAGLEDFSLKDVFKPEYGRTRRNLSAIINFAKFREERLIEYEEALAEKDEEERKYLEALAENERLKAEIAEAEAFVNENDPDALAREVAQLELEVEAASLEASEIEARALASENELQALIEEENRLKEQFEIEKAARANQEGAEQQLAAERQREEAQLQEQFNYLQSMEREMRETIEVMKGIEQSRKEGEEQKAKLKALEAEVSTAEEETWKLDAKMEQLQRQKQAMEEKMARMESQGKLKKDAAEAALRAAQEELAARTARAGHQRQKELENQKEIAELEAAMKKLTDEHNRDMDGLMRTYEELRDTVVEYHNELFEAMEDMNNKGQRRERAVAMQASPGGSSMLSTPPSAMSIDHY